MINTTAPLPPKLEAVVRNLEPTEQDLFMEVLHNPDEYSAAHISRQLTKHGHPVSQTLIKDYRRKLKA